MTIKVEKISRERLMQLTSLPKIILERERETEDGKTKKVPLEAMLKLYLTKVEDDGSVQIEHKYKDYTAAGYHFGRQYASWPSIAYMPSQI